MNDLISSLIDNTVQCWSCGIFDRLFRIVSSAAGAIYDKFAFIAIALLCAIMAFVVLSAVWKNIKAGLPDPSYKKSLQKGLVNVVIVLGLLSFGVQLPRLITTITFEPVTDIAITYTQSLLHLDTAQVTERITYTPEPMDDGGFFRPELRDKIIELMKTTMTQFQSYMKLGVQVIESAFSWDALFGIGAFFKHLILLIIGIFITWQFFKLFIRYCCYFADIIISMAFFAFFFPFSLMLMAFKEVEHVPSWVGTLGKNVGANQFKNLINAIVTLASAVISYQVIMVIIARFFAGANMSVTELMNTITSGNIFDMDLDKNNLAALTLGSCIVLMYVLNYIYSQIPQISKMIMSAFNVSESKQQSEALADSVMNAAESAWTKVKSVGAAITGKEQTPKDQK